MKIETNCILYDIRSNEFYKVKNIQDDKVIILNICHNVISKGPLKYLYNHMKVLGKEIFIYKLNNQSFLIIKPGDILISKKDRENNGILNHTDFYEYKHGKMLMHLKFCFESIPIEPTPAAMLRYYRQRKGLTTRQLAESVGIVPATLLMYEREKFPIPYQTAVAFADILEIDRNLLFDDFARFIDYPYSNRLREARKVCSCAIK